MTRDPFHDKLLEITLRLPGAYEDRPWGSVHCKVDEKIFVGWGRLEDGDMSVGFRVDQAFQSMLVASDTRFSIAKYVGKHGGVDMRLGPKPDWREVGIFIVESYRLIAKKSRVKELDALTARSPVAKPVGPPASRDARQRATSPTRPRASPKRRRARA